MVLKNQAEGGTPQFTAADLVAAVQTTPLTMLERAELLRAIRGSVSGLLQPDVSLSGKLRAAARLPVRFVEYAATGLENSDIWQKAAEAAPQEMRDALSRASDLQPLAEEAKALDALLQFNSRYNHWVAATKARDAYRVGRKIPGETAGTLKPHLDAMKEQLPKPRRKAKTSPSPTPAPPATPVTPGHTQGQ